MAAEQPPNAVPNGPTTPGRPGDKTSADKLAADMLMDQASIDELLRQASFEDPAALEAAALAAAGQPSNPASAASQAAPASPFDAASSGAAEPVLLPDTADFKLPNFQQVMRDAQVSSIDLLRDVELNVKIELGRSRMLVEDVLKLSEGSVVELDKLAGDPVDVFVNDRLVARGEVLVLNDNFCVRVNEIVAGAKDEGV
jgi:flagellar motor switch protein FliN/FliY